MSSFFISFFFCFQILDTKIRYEKVLKLIKWLQFFKSWPNCTEKFFVFIYFFKTRVGKKRVKGVHGNLPLIPSLIFIRVSSYALEAVWVLTWHAAQSEPAPFTCWRVICTREPFLFPFTSMILGPFSLLICFRDFRSFSAHVFSGR